MIYLLLFFEFFKMGLFTFGGGMSMIPLIEETVLKYGWISEDMFLDLVGVAESTPGPIAINMATYVGSVQGGALGGIIATLGVVLPSFIIIVLIASVLKNFTSNKYFKAFIKGVVPVITSLIFSTGIIMIAKVLGYVSASSFSFKLIPAVILAIIFALYLIALKLFKKKLSTIQIILVSALLGIILA